MSTQRLERDVAVITGAGRGIGAAIASRLAREGAAVVMCSRTLAEVEGVAASIIGNGGRALAVQCDVTCEDQIAGLAAVATDRFGPPNILVNNAGTYRVAPFIGASMEDFRWTMEVNFFGAVRVLQALLGPMVTAEHARVIFIASTAGKYGSINQSMYNASKHAVVGLMRCLALELAKTNVRVNAICPGFVDTPILRDAVPELARLGGVQEESVLEDLTRRIPVGRLGRPEEVAALCTYLASRESDYMTGHAITLAGGLILI